MAKRNIVYQFTVNVVKGGYVLTYPSFTENADLSKFGITIPFEPSFEILTEVFTSQRKLNQKIKEVWGGISHSSCPLFNDDISKK